MALHVTQCPSCDSSFNTSARLLEAANGLVRCGACLTVFEAAENFIAPVPLPRDRTGRTVSVYLSGQDEFVDLAMFVRKAGELKLQRQTEDRITPATGPETTTGKMNDGADGVPGASVATEVNSSDDAGPRETSTTIPIIPAEPVFDEAVPAHVFIVTDEDPGSPAPASSPPPPHPQPNPEQTNIKRDEIKGEFRARVNRVRLPDSEDEALVLDDQSLAALSLVPDALEIEYQPTRQGRARSILSMLGCLVLLLTLTGQFLWHRFDLLSLHPDLRPGYRLVCSLIGCQLPPVEDLANMRLEGLAVRTHPQRSDALMVSAVIVNTAPFQQPFPVLRLRFRDTTLQTVAAREFLPAEYLPATLRSIVNIPINTPVQITLELLDPGANAINYELDFLSSWSAAGSALSR